MNIQELLEKSKEAKLEEGKEISHTLSSDSYNSPKLCVVSQDLHNDEDKKTLSIHMKMGSETMYICSLPPMSSSDAEEKQDDISDVLEELTEVLSDGIKELKAIASNEYDKYRKEQEKESKTDK